MFHHSGITAMDCQHFFRQIFLGYFPDIVQAFDTLGRNVYGDDYTSLHNPCLLYTSHFRNIFGYDPVSKFLSLLSPLISIVK